MIEFRPEMHLQMTSLKREILVPKVLVGEETRAL